MVTPGTEEAWVEAAAGMSSRDLERTLRHARLGEEPDDVESGRAPERVRLVFECDASDAEAIRVVIAAVKAQTGHGSDQIEDGAALAALARRGLHELGPEDAPTGEPYRVILEHCTSCGRTAGIDAEARDTIVAEACCDSEVVDMRPGDGQGELSRTIPPRVRRKVLHRDGYRCVIPGCSCSLWLHLHHTKPFSEGGDHDLDNLETLCALHHRLNHEGELALEREPDGRLRVEWADGRVAHVDRRQ